jgi:hypothetical protein
MTGRQVAVAGRYLTITVVLLFAVGVAGHFVAWPVLTSTLGPTVYVFAANPGTEAARFRNATVGHAVAIVVGLGAVATFGLWNHAPVSPSHGPTLAQAAAAAAAAGVTLFVLELVGSHHAPSAASALLVATGLARPGKPLLGLVVGLVIVLVLGPLSGRLPLARHQTAEEARSSARHLPGPPSALSTSP